MIKLYESSATSFTTLGLAVLQPTECNVQEEAGGLYELTLIHPMNDSRYEMLTCGRIITAPTPTRESYTITIPGSTQTTVSCPIYKANQTSGGLNMRKQPNGAATIVGSLAKGEEVAKIDESGTAATGIWFKVKRLVNGGVGWVYSTYLLSAGRSENIIVDGGGTSSTEETLTMSKYQPFRIYSVEKSSEDRLVTIHAKHLTYDLMNACFSPQTLEADGITVAQAISNYLTNTSRISHTTGITISAKLTGTLNDMVFTNKNALEIVLGDNGIAEQMNAKVIRDRTTLYLIAEQQNDLGYEIRYGKNLLTANLKTDTSELANSVVAWCTVDSTYKASSVKEDSDSIATYGRIRRYVEHQGITSVSGLNDAAAKDLAEMKNPQYTLDTEFVNLALAPQFAAFANQYAVHIYDTINVTDPEVGIDMPIDVVGYTYDCLAEKYTSVTLGDLEDINFSV